MINKKEKKAWLKILEAVVAIFVILSAVVYIMSLSTPQRNVSKLAYEKEKYILEVIARNISMRAGVLSDNNNDINRFVEKMVPVSIGFETRICKVEDLCDSLTAPYDKEVYASEIVISSDLDSYNPRKLKIFLWQK